MNVFINGIGNISPQNTLDNSDFLTDVRNESSMGLRAVEPDYKTHLQGINSRRMSRLMKQGVASALHCLKDSGEEDLDAIITGTGLGFTKMTENFLTNIYKHDEGILSPTQFIQSTHNTISGTIALILKCDKYNFTYSNRGSSFESALLDGLMKVMEGCDSVLVGGFDEITENYLNITNRMKLWKTKEFSQLDLLSENNSSGTIPGEGSTFFMLNKKQSENTYCAVKGMKMLFNPKSTDLIEHEINDLLTENNLGLDQLDLCLLGLNGDKKIDQNITEVQNRFLSGVNACYFKHLCGEYKTATAFGMWIGAQILAKQSIPEVIKTSPFSKDNIDNVLIYNNYNNTYHTLILLQNVTS